LACGCSVETACAAILVSNAICWGPADPIDLAASKLMGIEVNMAEWFVRYQLPVFCVIFLVAIIVFLILYKSFDAKHATMTDPEMTTSADGQQTPGVYALLPLLPLVIMLVFSPFCLKMISIDINGAVTLSLVITMIVVTICNAGSKADNKADSKTAGRMTMTEIINGFVAGFCDSMKGLGMTVLFAMLFAASLNSIGGMAVIAQALMTMKMAPLLLILIVCIFSGIINIVVGSFIGALSIAEPIAATVAAATGISAPLMCFFVVISCGAGCICSPVNP
ncbi:MAG: Na+/H+ antiporter NhaC family protein, partial [Lachnospiraceae bacterium]